MAIGDGELHRLVSGQRALYTRQAGGGARRCVGRCMAEARRPFTAAYDALDHLPKFHFTRHLPEQVRLDGWAIDTFTCERHNSMVLEAAEPIEDTGCFERSVLARSLILHASKLTAL